MDPGDDVCQLGGLVKDYDCVVQGHMHVWQFSVVCGCMVERQFACRQPVVLACHADPTGLAFAMLCNCGVRANLEYTIVQCVQLYMITQVQSIQITSSIAGMQAILYRECEGDAHLLARMLK